MPAYGEVIQTLPFTVLGSHAREICLSKGYDPAALIQFVETAHERLARHGVKSIQFTHRNHAGSSYNQMVSRGAEMVPHNTLAEAFVQLREAVPAIKGKAWISFYERNGEADNGGQHGAQDRGQDGDLHACDEGRQDFGDEVPVPFHGLRPHPVDAPRHAPF